MKRPDLLLYFSFLRRFVFGMLFFLFIHCGKKTDLSFYYWKTNFSLSPVEQEALNFFKTKDIYLRFFDVDIRNGYTTPVGQLVAFKPSSGLNIIPVVYITNITFYEMGSPEKLEALPSQVYQKLEAMSKAYNIEYSEIQIDCDWSDGTKESYFTFLKKLKEVSKKNISTTIRLHQVKYHEQTGIPPADRLVLMFYNMGNLTDMDTNSILSLTDAEKYAESLGSYPQSLDLALPIFGWTIHRRGERIVQLYSKLNVSELLNAGFIQSSGDDQYLVTKSTLYNGAFFREGDVLKLEQVEQEDLSKAVELLKKHIKSEKRKIILFDLDEVYLRKYNNESLSKILSPIR
jgi:hypothetical protein